MTGHQVPFDATPATAEAVESWERVLEHLEAEVDAAQQALAGAGSPEPTTTFLAPVGLGPLPAELRDRARSVHERSRGAAEALALAAAAVAGELRALDAARSNRPPAYYVDSRC